MRRQQQLVGKDNLASVLKDDDNFYAAGSGDTIRPDSYQDWSNDLEKDFPRVSSQVPLSPGGDEDDRTSYYQYSEAETERGTWTGKFDFLLSLLGYSVGLGNVWRFPYLCYSNGGGAFLIPFICMMLLAGLPLMFMELSFGQYASLGPIAIFERFCPLFQGLGYGMVIVSGTVMLYYNMIIAWTIFYMIASWNRRLPWEHCAPEWSTPEEEVRPLTMNSLLYLILVGAVNLMLVCCSPGISRAEPVPPSGLTTSHSDGESSKPDYSERRIAQVADYPKQDVQVQETNTQTANTEEVIFPPKQYAFGYNLDDGFGATQHRQESSDESGVVRGSYGYRDALGMYRHVSYSADNRGFHAVVRSNEPGIVNKNSADVAVVAVSPLTNEMEN